MRTKKYFIFLSASIFFLLLFSARTINAQKNQNANGNGNQNQFGSGAEHGSYMNQFGQGIDKGYSMYRYGIENDGGSYGYQYNRGFENNSYGGPRWIMDPDNFPGMGPYWYRTDPVEGFGPWFWQAYNGLNVTDIAPTWYVDPENALCIPRWVSDDSLRGPWWWREFELSITPQ